jgi:protein required for attachment to host cells
MQLPHGAWVIVADGERHLVLENRGDPDLIDLRMRSHAHQTLAPDAEQGEDRPGRHPAPGGRRETVEETDWKRLDKARFAAQLAEQLNRAAAAGDLPSFALAADPRSLGEIRGHLDERVRGRCLREVAADHTHDSVGRIEAFIRDH